MFSSAVSVGSRLNCWKMNPTLVAPQRGQPAVGHAGQPRVADVHVALRHRVQPGEAVHERRLAGARRPHDRGELPAFQFDVDAVQRDDPGLPTAVRLPHVNRPRRDGSGPFDRERHRWSPCVSSPGVRDSSSGRSRAATSAAGGSPPLVFAWGSTPEPRSGATLGRLRLAAAGGHNFGEGVPSSRPRGHCSGEVVPTSRPRGHYFGEVVPSSRPRGHYFGEGVASRRFGQGCSTVSARAISAKTAAR